MVSPHCDDAVFACGDLIAAHPAVVVVTVFTAGPRERWLRAWDRDCGFGAEDDVMHVRRQEDAEALALLGARPVWLPFRDDQYGRDASDAEIAERLVRAIGEARASAVAIPLGLFHRDHVLAHDAAVRARAQRPHLPWLAYADALYRTFAGDPVGARLRSLGRIGVAAEPEALGGVPASPLKARAVACYRSQLRGLAAAGRAGHADALAPEAYWRLA